ncbi:tetraacyldisaccharide 4'-kinase [uncultured Helicobacter sp.]|uniref:tetraacyldisaccharide 4'-kinase n=1 Tax=uncultured Helicobacter sp. TaxID=175537 RepID=UPI001C3BAFF0|nr:tetraacyldisaccharide 4'-kinase [Candidatus Helicobacter avicola]
MRFIDSYFYNPSLLQKLLSFALLPISLLYAISATLRRKCARYYDFGIPIISVGNLIVGGSGKTPFIIEIARFYPQSAVILRGYKRQSKGLVVVSHNGKILCTQPQAGDEAYLLAKNLPDASVIVSKNRKEAIQKAKELGAQCIFLDDGFRFHFKKLNILLQPKLQPYFPFLLPSGMYREMPYLYKYADLLVREGEDYTREVFVENPTPRMLLLTAIANPARLDEFLPSVVGKITLQDHSSFDEPTLRKYMQSYNATSLLVTSKDEVKLENMGFTLSVLRLRLHIQPYISKCIDSYITTAKS